MYKVKEAADQLGVSRVEIFEILLSQRDVFEPFVTKKNSITYISEEGLAFLKERLEKESLRGAEAKPSTLESGLASESLLESAEESIEENFDVNCDEDLEEDAHEELRLSEVREKNESNEFEQVDDALSDWLKEIQDETILSDTYDLKLREIRSQITITRNKILGLDSEIKMKEDAIRHYHEIMKDDIRWLEDLERKIQITVKNRFIEAEDSNEPQEEIDEEKGNFRKFFKR